jgi:phenylacetate-CoA ligase
VEKEHHLRGWFSRNLFIPWIILGPWTGSKRLYRGAMKEARAGFREWERSGPEERAGWVLKELRAIVRWAGERVPYYQELFRRVGFDSQTDFSFADYARLPVLERSTLRERADELIATGFSKQKMRQNSTGGSTGMPVRFWLDERSSAWRWVASEWAFSKFGYREGDRLGMIWGFNADPHVHRSTKARISSWLAHRQVNECYRLSDEILDRIDARLSEYRPDFLRCYASAVGLLAHRLRRLGKQPTYPNRAIFTGAEKLNPYQRKVIEEIFAVPVHESYGSRDCGLIAMQIDAFNPTLHVAGANIFVEPYGEPDANSGTEIVVTDLHRMGMPFLRYRIGDRARFVSASDRPVELLDEISGRTADHIRLPNGRIVHGVQFPRLFREFDVCEYQVVQEANGDIRVSLIAGPHLKSYDMTCIERILQDNLGGVSVSIELLPAIDRTAAGKLRPVVSHYHPIDAAS